MAEADATITPDWLARQIPGTRAEDVRGAVAGLISSGALLPGAHLPTIRQLADHLDTKVSAVTDAWTMLRRDGLVETRRRGGTRVAGTPAPDDAGRAAAHAAGHAERSAFAGWSSIELADAWPDISLLPATEAAFAASVDHTRPFGQFPTVTAALAAALSSSWAFEAESFTVLTSGKAALKLTLDAALDRPFDGPGRGRGRVVAVETPGLVRSAAVLRTIDAQLIPLDGDAEGPTVGSVREALARGASVITLQPACSIPVGSTLSVERRDALAALISAHPDRVVVIEEDPVGLLFAGTSLGAVLPDRTVRLTQYWRALGPDIDMVAVGGSAAVVERVRVAQRLAGLRTGGLLQEVVTRLLGDPRARSLATAAGRRYATRNTAFVGALVAHGVTPASFGGLFAWVPVRDAEATLASLAAGGIRLLGGDSSFAVAPTRDFVRLATTRLPDDPFHVADLAAAVAAAAQGGVLVDTE